jgi:hypothetical protein
MASHLLKVLKRKLNSAFYVALRLINYYPHFAYLHNRGSKINLTSEYKIEFTPEEKVFLKACAASYNYFDSDFALGLRQKEISIYKLEHVTFFSHTGIIMMDLKLIVESGLSVDRLTQTKAYRDFSLMIPRYFEEATYTTIQHSHWADNNVYHWFVDCLPRLYIITHMIKEPVTLLLNDGTNEYQKAIIDFILKDYPHIKVKYLKKYFKININHFYLPSFVASSYSGYLPSEVNNWLREKIWNNFKVDDADTSLRIYISRSNARSRRILNEEKLLLLLQKFGFITIRPEELNFQQQIKLFYKADVILSSHGAGLTNILFAKKCTVLELHPANIIKPLYMLMSKGLNFDYTPIIGSNGDQNEDFSVPLQEVENWLVSRYSLKP